MQEQAGDDRADVDAVQRGVAEQQRADDLHRIERAFAEEDDEDEHDDRGHDQAGDLPGDERGYELFGRAALVRAVDGGGGCCGRCGADMIASCRLEEARGGTLPARDQVHGPFGRSAAVLPCGQCKTGSVAATPRW